MKDTGAGSSFDFAVIGAGIAGASVASELAKEASVLLLEMEAQPGYHTTGRSAAMFAPGYGPQPIRALTRASTSFFHDPPDGFYTAPLLSPRHVAMIARTDQMATLDAFLSEVSEESAVEKIDEARLRQIQPLVREGYAQAGILDTRGSEIDVHGLHHGFLNQFRQKGGALLTNAEVLDLNRQSGSWNIATKAGEFDASVIVNAAGAWADQMGAMAGAETIGLVPKRRTALMIDAPEDVAIDHFPLVVDIDEEFYMKPDAGRLLISPANEDPMCPCDVQPEEMDVALCIDRIEKAFDIEVRQIRNQWAGLRSFVADKSPVVGFSAKADGFFWLAGQGGYGIQSSPALARYAAVAALGNEMPQDILQEGLVPESLSPERLMASA